MYVSVYPLQSAPGCVWQCMNVLYLHVCVRVCDQLFFPPGQALTAEASSSRRPTAPLTFGGRGRERAVLTAQAPKSPLN